MRISICAAGKLRAGPERQLVDDYIVRASATGRGIGITSVSLQEIEEKRNLTAAALKAGEAARLKAACPRGAHLVALDERGRMETSPAFAKRLGEWRDRGIADVAFVIGGADGLSAELRDEADYLLAFGPMTWPHMLVRVMLTEQIYRAITILSGHPYHHA